MTDNNLNILLNLSLHHIGNKVNGGELILSDNELDIAAPDFNHAVRSFFLESFEWLEYYNFTFSNDEISLNPVYNFCERIFRDQTAFHSLSQEIAGYLYEHTTHPQIKNGDLLVTLFENVLLEDELVDVIGIFKSENKQGFLKVDVTGHSFSVDLIEGIQLDKLDKACLVFNTEKESGYRIALLDRSNKITEAQYWREQFLNVKPAEDAYHQTRDFLQVTKNFITRELPKETGIDKSEQAELLNRSIGYFKSNTNFNKEEFEETVFQDPVVRESFRHFEPGNNKPSMHEFADSFEISDNAVRKQSKVYKSVIKLDKNFHIYVHGDRELIEQGRDPDGRKYYKIYFNEET